MKKITTDKLVSNLLVNLPARQREVLECRYGLKNGPEMTLAEIGEKYDVTRERVRQIESLSLQAVKKSLNHKDFESFVVLAVNHFKAVGGARREDFLEADLKKVVSDNGPAKSFGNRLKFLLEVSGRVAHQPAEAANHAFWYLGDSDERNVNNFAATLAATLTAGTDWQSLLQAPFAKNYLSISKKFANNSYNDFGLAEWPHINPKTARDWAYLVLKKKGQPLHFTQLAKMINTMRKGKVTNIQTVHNELIKDKRFVLVGRGIYGLQEFNLMAGTCKEVIRQILDQHGPQTSRDLIKLVLAKRDFKENTLILNLQNKQHFTRKSDGRYAVKEV